MFYFEPIRTDPIASPFPPFENPSLDSLRKFLHHHQHDDDPKALGHLEPLEGMKAAGCDAGCGTLLHVPERIKTGLHAAQTDHLSWIVFGELNRDQLLSFLKDGNVLLKRADKWKKSQLQHFLMTFLMTEGSGEEILDNGEEVSEKDFDEPHHPAGSSRQADLVDETAGQDDELVSIVDDFSMRDSAATAYHRDNGNAVVIAPNNDGLSLIPIKVAISTTVLKSHVTEFGCQQQQDQQPHQNHQPFVCCSTMPMMDDDEEQGPALLLFEPAEYEALLMITKNMLEDEVVAAMTTGSEAEQDRMASSPVGDAAVLFDGDDEDEECDAADEDDDNMLYKQDVMRAPSAHYIGRLSVENKLPASWSKDSRTARIYMETFLYGDYLKASNNLVLPDGALVTFGSGSTGETFLADSQPAGDIVFGLYRAVPPARDEYAGLSVGAQIQNIRVMELDEQISFLNGSHWGYGVTLLDRDRLLCSRYLAVAYTSESKRNVSAAYNHLLRAFFFGRTYIRAYCLGGSRGHRIRHQRFISDRFEAIKNFVTCDMRSFEEAHPGTAILNRMRFSRRKVHWYLIRRVKNFLQERQVLLKNQLGLGNWLKWFNDTRQFSMEAKKTIHKSLQSILWETTTSVVDVDEGKNSSCSISRDADVVAGQGSSISMTDADRGVSAAPLTVTGRKGRGRPKGSKNLKPREDVAVRGKKRSRTGVMKCPSI